MKEYQGVAGSASELNSPWHGNGPANKKRHLPNPSCTGIGQRVAAPSRQLGSSHLVLKVAEMVNTNLSVHGTPVIFCNHERSQKFAEVDADVVELLLWI